MDFFQAQDDARRSTWRLVLLFALAVICLIVLTNVLILIVFEQMATHNSKQAVNIVGQVDWRFFFMVGAAVTSVVIVGSLYKILQLSGGGSVVAESLGGTPLNPASRDLLERRLLNVVEEMAIASGTAVPQVYLLNDEDGINAFAAGFKPGDAVIGITRGTMERLSRDELQGVIAHEFSHILNGDMRMNIRLIGILHGILVIGLIGQHILRGMSHGRSRSSKKDGAGGILVLALGLMAIGYAGTFFGNIIKASISRQREYLADSSAVQFTRNPSGIAGALKKIGGLYDDEPGSKLETPNAPQMSHAYFSQGIVIHLFRSLFATHPPLQDRIKRIEPSWNGKYLSSHTATEHEVTEEANVAASRDSRLKTGKHAGLAAVAASLMENIGRPSPDQLDYAQQLLNTLPANILDNIHDPYGARAIIYCLLMHKDAEIRTRQFNQLQQYADTGVHDLTGKLHSQVTEMGIEKRLPLIELAMPALRKLSAQQYNMFKNNLQALIAMDSKVDLFEWSLQKILLNYLEPVFSKSSPRTAKYHSLQKVRPECEILISLLLHACTSNQQEQLNGFNAARKELGFQQMALLPRDQVSLDRLNSAIDELSLLMPLLKPRLLKACLLAITQDRNYSATEMELMRAIADTLDCPIPPYVG